MTAADLPIATINEVFLCELDGMIDSTIEFINDDGLMADETRIHDLAALLTVKNLWDSTFKLDPNAEETPTP